MTPTGLYRTDRHFEQGALRGISVGSIRCSKIGPFDGAPATPGSGLFAGDYRNKFSATFCNAGLQSLGFAIREFRTRQLHPLHSDIRT